MEALIIVIIAAAVICVIAFLYWLFKKKLGVAIKLPKHKKEKKPKQKQPEKKSLYEIKKFNLELTDKFMYRKELLLWRYMISILPRTFIVIPKVSIPSIVNPNGDKNLYNDVIDKTLDLVVFDEQNMRPLLAIDIFDNTYGDERMDEQDPKLYAIISKLGLKMVHVHMKLDFNKEEIKRQVYKELNIQLNEKDE